jgi:hypothetical protein
MAIKDPGDPVGSLANWPPRSGSVIKIYNSADTDPLEIFTDSDHCLPHDYHISIVKISKEQFILKNEGY